MSIILSELENVGRLGTVVPGYGSDSRCIVENIGISGGRARGKTGTLHVSTCVTVLRHPTRRVYVTRSTF